MQKLFTFFKIRSSIIFYVLAIMGFLILGPEEVKAQYKNAYVGLEGGGWLLTKPPITDEQGQILPLNRRPIRLSSGFRFAGEAGFKLDEDHWWLTGSVGLGFLNFGNDSVFDQNAANNLGTMMALEPKITLKYYFLTDDFRPYLAMGLSYMHLFSFAQNSGDTCIDPTICLTTNGSYLDNYLTHTNLLVAHLESGLEIFIVRDIALRLFVDAQRWLVINAADNTGLVLGVGLNFFT